MRRSYRWTRDDVLAAIERWALIHGKAPSSTDWALPDRPQWAPHPAVAVRLFGTWRDALRAAGHESRYREWSGEAILDEIRRWVSEYGSPPKCTDWHGSMEWPPPSTVATEFGSWNAAIAAAGHSTRPVGRPRKVAA